MEAPVRRIVPAETPEADALVEACRGVFDPELPVDVWALGLVRSIEVEPFGRVVVEMALTSPGCPSAQALPDAVRAACEGVVGEGRVSVLVRFDLPWEPSWVEDDARLALVSPDVRRVRPQIPPLCSPVPSGGLPMRALPPPLTFTPAALGRLREIATGTEGRRLRIDVRARGCSGHSYDLSYVDAPQPGDMPVPAPETGIEVLIARRAELFLLGAEVDYERTPLREGFAFRNPNEKGRCGCGESFHA